MRMDRDALDALKVIYGFIDGITHDGRDILIVKDRVELRQMARSYIALRCEAQARKDEAPVGDGETAVSDEGC